MADVVVFHHAQGLTPGIVAFADELRGAGHTVHVPDLYERRTFEDLEAGVAHADEVGFDTIIERGVRAADRLPASLVHVGFSLGVLPAQKLAQTRPGARGAVLFGSCVPPSEFGTPWPPEVPIQIHGMDADPIFTGEGDLDAARELVSSVENAEMLLYPGNQHLFADNSVPAYDPSAARLFTERVMAFLGTGEREG